MAPSFINSISTHQAPTMYQVLGEAYTLSALFLYSLTLGNTKSLFRVDFLLARCSMVMPVSCVFKFSYTSSLFSVPLPTDFSGTQTSSMNSCWLSSNSRALPSTVAQAAMGEQLVLFQLTSIFNNIPGFAAPYFSFGPWIQHCSLIHHLAQFFPSFYSF